MNPHRLPPPQSSALQRFVAAIVGGLFMFGLFVVGLFASVILAGIALVGGLLISVWLWRQKRQFAKFRAAHEAQIREAMGGSSHDADDAIEGEYIVRKQHDHTRP